MKCVLHKVLVHIRGAMLDEMVKPTSTSFCAVVTCFSSCKTKSNRRQISLHPHPKSSLVNARLLPSLKEPVPTLFSCSQPQGLCTERISPRYIRDLSAASDMIRCFRGAERKPVGSAVGFSNEQDASAVAKMVIQSKKALEYSRHDNGSHE